MDIKIKRIDGFLRPSCESCIYFSERTDGGMYGWCNRRSASDVSRETGRSNFCGNGKWIIERNGYYDFCTYEDMLWIHLQKS